MTGHRTFAFLAGGMLAATLLLVTVPARAQGVLGRVRDRARAAVSGNQDQPRAECSPTEYSRAVEADVTDDIVTRYLRALSARNAEMRRIAGTSTPEGRYFAAQLRRDSLANRHEAFRHHFGTDWARYQQLQSRPPSTDYQTNVRHQQELAAIEQGLDESQVRMPELDWNTQKSANDRMDAAALQAGGLSICQWSVVVDIVPTVIQSVAGDRAEGRPARGANEFTIGRNSGLRAGELRVIRAHAAELAGALGAYYPSDAEVAAMQREKARQDSARSAMEAWNACQQRAAQPTTSAAGMGMNSDSMRVWQRQLEDAQKRGDQAALMAIGTKMAMAMQAGGMGQRAQAVAQAQQACGPMPGQPKR